VSEIDVLRAQAAILDGEIKHANRAIERRIRQLRKKEDHLAELNERIRAIDFDASQGELMAGDGLGPTCWTVRPTP
jgi:hypothetical protein